MSIDQRRRLSEAATRHAYAALKCQEALFSLDSWTDKYQRLWKAYLRLMNKSDALFDAAING